MLTVLYIWNFLTITCISSTPTSLPQFSLHISVTVCRYANYTFSRYTYAVIIASFCFEPKEELYRILIVVVTSITGRDLYVYHELR